MPEADAPINAKSWAEALYHPDDSKNDLHRDIWPEGIDGRWSMGSEVEIWSTGSPLDVFVSLFSSLLLFLLDFSPVQMASARVFTTFGVSQVEGDFSHAPNLSRHR
jgi:hypothetical protein